MTPQRFQQLLAQFRSKRIAVIGDLMLDEFVWGKVGRISPEAPVPVVEVTGESFYPGGAANVARNLREFVAHVSVVGMIGEDAGGQRLRELLHGQNIDVAGVIGDASYRTIVKTRIIARQQQVVRVDREEIRPANADQLQQAIAHVRRNVADLDAVIFEDYGKGFLDSEMIATVCRDARQAGKIVTADPNPRHQLDWQGVTAVKPNRSEAFEAAGVRWNDPAENPSHDEPLLETGRRLLEKWSTDMLLITLGEQGMMLFERGAEPHHIPTKARQVFDVSGAGDTAIALFTLALCCGGSAVEAAEIANHASAVVVAKLGTATVTREELIASFNDDENVG